MAKIYIADIRLKNNAGITMPVCYASMEGPLRVDTGTGHKCSDPKSATCKHCIRIYPKRYPWTVR